MLKKRRVISQGQRTELIIAFHLINLKKINGRKSVNCSSSNLNRNMVGMAHRKTNEDRFNNKIIGFNFNNKKSN